jgi:cytochrome c peroxidase
MRAHAFRQSVSAFAAACLATGVATGVAAAQETDQPDTDAPAAAELRDLATGLFSTLPMNPPELPGNVLTRARIDLGTQLFFDPRLSRSWVFSCNSCHNIGMGGVDGLEVSIGHGWQTGPRNSPTVFNAVFNAAQFWDGRAADLAEQAMGPVQAGVEMASTPERVVETLTSMPGYIAAFEAAFPGQEDPVTFENMALAIEAFEATLITPNDRFDQFLQGDDNALDAAEKRGLLAFIEQGCAACHNGVNLGGQAYFPFGVVERPGGHVLPEGDRGRFQVTETGRRRLRLPRLAAAQHCPDRALLPLRRHLGPRGGGGDHGRLPARRRARRGRDRRHHRPPAYAQRRDPAGSLPRPAGDRPRHAAPRPDVAAAPTAAKCAHRAAAGSSRRPVPPRHPTARRASAQPLARRPSPRAASSRTR